MSNVPHSDNVGIDVAQAGPDASGHTAMLLVESLIHGLIERSVITVEDAVDVVDTAADVNEDMAAEAHITAFAALRARNLLAGIAQSLTIDLLEVPDGFAPM